MKIETMKIETMKIHDIQKGYREKKFTAVEITKTYLDRVKKFDNGIKAFITLSEETALREAAVIDAKILKGEEVGVLGGIPIAIKDNICTRGIRTTCASKMLEDFIPPYDATVVKKLKEAGGIILGKTNMDEFGMGASTENSAFAITRNPWNSTKVPGGSSGGGAAAVAAGFVPLALGSDTGGSVRQPASFCGIVGLKPTYDLVSRYGLVAFSSSLDHIGSFSRTVEDCALSLQVIQGQDKRDITSYKGKIPEEYISEFKKGVKGIRIGIPKELFQGDLDPEVTEGIKNSIEILEKLGANLEEFSLPITEAALSIYYIISSTEASSNLARYDGVGYGHRTKNFENIDELMIKSRTEGFGKEVKKRIMLGTYVLSSGNYDIYYKKAVSMTSKIKDSFAKAFESYDILLSPTSPILPFSIGERAKGTLQMHVADIYTVSINIAGVPAISLPCGFSASKLPIGLQLIGNHFSEKQLLKVAYHLEQELQIHKIMPILEEV